MATDEERRKILEMVAEGKLSASQGAQLLQGDAGVAEGAPQSEKAAPETVEVQTSVAEVPVEEAPVQVAPVKEAVEKEMSGETEWESEDSLNWLHIRIDDYKSGRSKIQVNIPLGLLKFGAKLGSGVLPELSKADWQMLRSSLKSGEGMLIDIDDEHQGERVQIYLG